jgi:ABC-type nitrate/sulfonate/bicarbonate transport system substrate-binding protein
MAIEIRRRRWLAVLLGLALAASAAACSSSGSGSTASGTLGSKQLQTVRLQLDWVLDSEFAPIFVADSKGYYAKEGIKLDIIPGGPSLQNVEAVVAGGKADIGMSTFMSSTVNAAAQGTSFIVLGPFYATSPAVWMSPPNKPVKTAQDFVGKKIGAPQGRQVQINAIFKINHLPAGDYTFVPTSFDASPLAHHAVDVQSGYITSEAVNYKQLTGKAPYTVSYAAVGLPDPSSTFFTTPQYLSQHRALVVGFLRATMKGILANEADPAYGAKITTDTYGKSLNLKYGEQLAMNKLYLPLYENNLSKQHGLLYLDPSYVAGPVYRGYRAAEIKTVPVNQILDTSLQADAAKGVKQPS